MTCAGVVDAGPVSLSASGFCSAAGRGKADAACRQCRLATEERRDEGILEEGDVVEK